MAYVISKRKTSRVSDAWNAERNLHNSLKFLVFIFQIFGIFPLENTLRSSKDVCFRWKSWKVLYTCLLFVITNFVVVICFLAWFYIGYSLVGLGRTVFYLGLSLNLILYLHLARSWPRLVKQWCKMDRIMNESYGYPEGLDTRFRLITFIFLIFALVEQMLMIISRYMSLKQQLKEEYTCEKFFLDEFRQMFVIFPVNWLTMALSLVITAYSNFVWILNDVFIILMSTALALRFRQISKKISKEYKTMKSESAWTKIREDYDRLSILCKELDDSISYIVLVSYFMNMFFLLIQLYHSLELASDTAKKIYFFYSLCIIILKLVSVSLYGAWINDESLGPAPLLNAVSSDFYNSEIRRLLVQISFDNVAITGFRMFKITRGIMLSIAGAIVTYELVLIQFNAASDIQT